MQCKCHSLIPIFARPKIAIQITNYLRNRISKQFLEAELTNNTGQGKWTETHKKKLRHLSQTQQKITNIKTRFTEKIIQNFLHYALSEEEETSFLIQLRQMHSSQIERKQDTN